MSKFEIWSIYFAIAALSAIPFFLIKETVQNRFLKILHSVGGIIFVMVAGTFVLVSLIFVYEYFFPFSSSGTSTQSIEDYEQCERDYYRGGCL